MYSKYQSPHEVSKVAICGAVYCKVFKWREEERESGMERGSPPNQTSAQKQRLEPAEEEGNRQVVN